ncbi:MAG: hypothetical protein N2037_01885, partial [Acidimicrobiales bacterium]|nr:hypothetical protein [Acidimicrobiales bacterium]
GRDGTDAASSCSTFRSAVDPVPVSWLDPGAVGVGCPARSALPPHDETVNAVTKAITPTAFSR